MGLSFGGPSPDVSRPKFWFTVTFKSGHTAKVHAYDRGDAMTEAEKAHPGEKAVSAE